MKITTLLPAALLFLVLCLPPAAAAMTDPQQARPGDCTQAVTLLRAQNKKLSRELRQIKREIAALRQDLGQPGLGEILGGIGYILGLFGVAAWMAAKRQQGEKR